MSQKCVGQDGLMAKEDRRFDLPSGADENGVFGDNLFLRSREGDVFLSFNASWAGPAWPTPDPLGPVEHLHPEEPLRGAIGRYA